jgi:dihydroorotate dehydrogenase
MYSLLRPLIFRLDPEVAHDLTVSLLRLVGALPFGRYVLKEIYRAHSRSKIEAFGLEFPNPVGLAAGYDKDGLAWRGLAGLGFGHLEIGTVTPEPQAGNPKPRVFRLPEEQAVINRMGFPGRGAEHLAQRLRGARGRGFVLGVNIGKNRDTPNEEAARDYLPLMRAFAPLADYIAINVSSPNTIGLRRLQAREALDGLLSVLSAERAKLLPVLGRQLPLLVKLAPDLNDNELDDALEVITRTGMDGVIATNTTVSREGLRSPIRNEAGGLSGEPLRRLSTEMVRKIAERTAGRLPVIGVGGIMTPDDAKEKLDAGAALVQVYTGLVYKGPGLVKEIVKAI